MRAPFPWYGGKSAHARWVIQYLPPHRHYVEPFCGSAAVLFAKDPSAAETLNDRDDNIVNFFKQLRERTDDLARSIACTPHSRVEFQDAVVNQQIQGWTTDLERARQFFVLACNTRMARAATATFGRWQYSRDSTISRPWFGDLDRLYDAAERLLRVQLESDDAATIIHRYDSPTTLFYVDPPYPHELRNDSRVYRHEMDGNGHDNLANLLQKIRGKALVSGYQDHQQERRFLGWRRVDGKPRTIPSSVFIGANGIVKTESLWMNF